MTDYIPKKKPRYKIWLIYALPIGLLLTATFIKAYALSSVGNRVPVVLYLLIISICSVLVNIRSGMVALTGAIALSMWISLDPSFYNSFPKKPFLGMALYGISAIIILVMLITYLRINNIARLKDENLKSIIDAVPNKIYTSDAYGIATYYNKEWYQYTGCSNFNELKEKIWTLIPDDDVEKIKNQYPQFLAERKPYEVEHRLRNRDGDYRWHLAHVKPLLDNAGNVQMWVGSCTDINDQKEIEERKDNFFSIASHELKTPLTSARAYLQIALKGLKETDNVYPFVKKSLLQLNRLQNLTADLLDVSKIASGNIQYTQSVFNFNTLLTDNIAAIRKTISTHQINIVETIDADINGDYQRLEQVLNNLILNAVKYSPGADQIEIRCRIITNFLVTSVRDFGIGISKEHFSKLFERFYRIDDTAMHFQGMGLGLYIVSEILQQHNGRFWVESNPGQGSTFYFMIPLIHPVGEPAEARETNDLFINEHISIVYNHEARQLEIDWKGFQNYSSVTNGCMKMLDYLKRFACHKIMNDNRNVLGTWSDAADWVGREWFPMMEKAGLSHFAWIYSLSTYSQLSADRSADTMAGNINIRLFNSEADARNWLKEV